ncbi:MAG: molybdopterin molybdotransferase MoeA [Eubacterium sp.]|nr:molybdopterin molybdotransferase MoeA [Eubacterium sp.]
MKKHEILSIPEATSLICQSVHALEIEKIPIMDGLGRILAENVTTKIAQPPFPRSAMDGYAIIAEDSQNSSHSAPKDLKVVGIQYAGDPYFRSLKKGEALRIMTGAAIPDGADAVIRQEDTDCGLDKVRIFAQVCPGENYCEIGEDFPEGDCLALKGDKIDAFLISAAAAGGIREFVVRRIPRISIITTGDEIQDPGSHLGEGKIYNSIMALLIPRLKQLGCDVCLSVSAGDSEERIVSFIRHALKVSDLIITTGGVSVGMKDCIPAVMKQLEADVIFHGLAIKPGMPTMLSLVEDIPVLSLSGNPYSASAVFELLVQPMIAKMTACRQPVLKKVKGITREGFRKTSGFPRFLRGYYEEGKISFGPGQRNGQTKAGIGCNCLICLEADSGPLDPGDEVTAYII